MEGDRFFHELAEEVLKEVQFIILRDIFLLSTFIFQLETDAGHELLTSLLAVHRNLFEILGQFFRALGRH